MFPEFQLSLIREEKDSSIAGYGVPQWYGSAENSTSYTNMSDEELLSLFQTHQQWLMNNGFTSFHEIVPSDDEVNEEALSHLRIMTENCYCYGIPRQTKPIIYGYGRGVNELLFNRSNT